MGTRDRSTCPASMAGSKESESWTGSGVGGAVSSKDGSKEEGSGGVLFKSFVCNGGRLFGPFSVNFLRRIMRATARVRATEAVARARSKIGWGEPSAAPMRSMPTMTSALVAPGWRDWITALKWPVRSAFRDEKLAFDLPIERGDFVGEFDFHDIGGLPHGVVFVAEGFEGGEGLAGQDGGVGVGLAAAFGASCFAAGETLRGFGAGGVGSVFLRLRGAFVWHKVLLVSLSLLVNMFRVDFDIPVLKRKGIYFFVCCDGVWGRGAFLVEPWTQVRWANAVRPNSRSGAINLRPTGPKKKKAAAR